MSALPGWLMARARTGGFARVHVLLPPVGERTSAIYLLEAEASPEARYEIHAVDDAEVGIDGCTIPLLRGETYKLLSALAGAFTGRMPGVEIVPLMEPPSHCHSEVGPDGGFKPAEEKPEAVS